MSGYVLKISRHGDIRREAFNPADSLKQLQRAVGGFIERVEIPAFTRERLDCDCWVNEEGLFDPDPVLNIAVTEMAGRGIVGDAVLAMHDGEGRTLGIPEPLARVLAKYAKSAFAVGVVRRMRFAPMARKENEDDAKRKGKGDA